MLTGYQRGLLCRPNGLPAHQTLRAIEPYRCGTSGKPAVAPGVHKMARQPLSLDQPVGDHEDNDFGEFLEENCDQAPLYDTNLEALKQRLEEVMTELSHREREILRLRYGLADGYTYTLEEVGKIFSVTRERVRQIESKAVRKLQSPYRSLTGFLNNGEPAPLDTN